MLYPASSNKSPVSSVAGGINSSPSFNTSNGQCKTESSSESGNAMQNTTKFGSLITETGFTQCTDIREFPKSSMAIEPVEKNAAAITPPNPPAKPSKQELCKVSKNGIPTDWGFNNKQGVLDAQLRDEDEWDLCPELEKFRINEGEKTWNQLHRERCLEMLERRRVMDEKRERDKNDTRNLV